MKVSLSQVIACVTRPDTKLPMRVSVGVNTACARRHTSPALKMSRQPSESVKRLKASRTLWNDRPSAAV